MLSTYVGLAVQTIIYKLDHRQDMKSYRRMVAKVPTIYNIVLGPGLQYILRDHSKSVMMLIQ